MSFSSFLTVEFSFRSLICMSTPNSLNNRTFSWIVVIDVNPAEYRSVSTPNASVPITPLTMSNIFCWTSFSGGVRSSAWISGFGSLRLSTLLLTLSGMASICMVTAGTMYGGFLSAMNELSSFTSILESDTTYAAMNFPPEGASNAATVASLIPGNSRMTFSTSVSSILNPLTLTCPSFLPMYSIAPSGSHLTMSPVRYARRYFCSLQNGLTMKTSEVLSGLFRYPLVTCGPATTSSPGIPTGSWRPFLSMMYALMLSLGLPIGHSGLSSLTFWYVT